MKTYHDIVGDGGSNVVAQVEAQQKAIEDALAGVRHVLAVGSGKGGVGKSTVTMALAQALSREGRRIAILDGDFNGPCQAQMAGLTGVPWVPGDGGLALPRNKNGLGVVSFGSLLGEGRPVEVPSVAPDEEHVWRATREFATLRQLLSAVDWGELDVLVFDLPPGTERTMQFAQALTALPRPPAFVLVTIPSDLSRGVVARSVSALADSGARVLGYLENMDGYYCGECDEIRPLFPASSTVLDLPRLGSIPFDPALAELCDRGWPEQALPGSNEPKSFGILREVARNVLRELESTP